MENGMSFQVIGIGDNVVDKYVDQGIMYPGGNALNFAAYAAKMGTKSAYMGVFGDDFAAEHIKKSLCALGVDYSHSVSLEGENGFAKVGLQQGERVFLGSNRGGVAKSNPIKFTAEDIDYIKQFNLIHTSINSYLDIKLSELRSFGVPISFDFSNKITPWYIVNVCPYIDFAVVSCGGMTDEKVSELIEKTHKAGTPYIIATRGGEGSIFSDRGTIYTHKIKPVEAVDTLGAGDSFLTAFLSHFLSKEVGEDRGAFINRCMEEASSFAAETCMLEGAFGFGTPII